MLQAQKYKIEKKIQETHNVFLLNLVPIEGEIFDYKPGQFVLLTIFEKNGQPWRALPYSLCTSPDEKSYVQLGIKVHGEFTQKAAKLKEGDVVGIKGPFGKFVFDEKKIKNCVMLAGGIGIAPLMSSIRYAAQNHLPNKILLIYGNLTHEDIAFQKELDEIAQKNENFEVVYTIDKKTSQQWKGETGFITENMIKRYCHAVDNSYFFLCGPPIFIKVMTKILAKCSVKKEFIKIEKFG